MQQSLEWRHSGSSRFKKFRVQKYAGKTLPSVFLGQPRGNHGWWIKINKNKITWRFCAFYKENCWEKTWKLVQTYFVFAGKFLCTQIAHSHANNWWFGVGITWTLPLSTGSARLSYLSSTEKSLKGTKFSFNEEMIEVLNALYAEQDKIFF